MYRNDELLLCYVVVLKSINLRSVVPNEVKCRFYIAHNFDYKHFMNKKLIEDSKYFKQICSFLLYLLQMFASWNLYDEFFYLEQIIHKCSKTDQLSICYHENGTDVCTIIIIYNIVRNRTSLIN